MRVLLFEPNNYHYEVIPGFVRYFIDLGYEVDVLEYYHEDSEFCDCDFMPNVYFYENNNDKFCKLKELLSTKKYKYLMFTSLDYEEDGVHVDLFRKINEINHSVKCIGCFHKLNNISTENEIKALQEDRIMSLTASSKYGSKMVCPLYFGKFDDNKKLIKSTIVSIGSSNDILYIENSLAKLKKTNPCVNVLHVGNCNLSILKKRVIKRFICRPILKLANLWPYCSEFYSVNDFLRVGSSIEFLGKVSFKELYKLIHNSRFLLFAADDREDFKTVQTTGTRQLSLGFTKPCIIEETMGRFYGFDDTNAIIYKFGELDNAIRIANEMDEHEYDILCKNLKDLSKKIYLKSLSNLQQILNDAETT